MREHPDAARRPQVSGEMNRDYIALAANQMPAGSYESDNGFDGFHGQNRRFTQVARSAQPGAYGATERATRRF
jgi:hypothetical protein